MQKVNQRVISVDVFRGLVMLLMMAEVLEFSNVSAALPDSKFWQFLSFHQSHVPWVGCSLHDLIQPSFSFLVGVALPFSLSKSLLNLGQSKAIIKAIKRSFILVFLGIFLRSIGSPQTYFTFEDTLTQIGLGYPILFALGFVNWKKQIASFLIILVSYYLFFFFANNPYHTIDTNYTINGLGGHWSKFNNPALTFDQWFLNIFPTENPFLRNGGGYVTLSFIPTLATMIAGLIAGNLLKSKNSETKNLKYFIGIGLTAILLGMILDATGICPNVKRIWTPTWVIFSGGFCFLFLALFYWLIDIKKTKSWAKLLLVIGSNSIAAYVIAHTLNTFISASLFTHFGSNYNLIFGEPFQSLVHGGLILFFECYVLWWMYRKKLFIKI
jgi:predicted acyltransferase